MRNYAGVGILLGIQFVTAGISFFESSKAANALAWLNISLKPLAVVKRDSWWQNMDAAGVVPGDLIILAAGSVVPADCYVNEGEIEVDQSAVTGEPLPVKLQYGDYCKMGSTVTRGETGGTVAATGQNTFSGRIAAMLQSVDNVEGSSASLKSLVGIMKVLASSPLSLCTISFIFLVIRGNKGNDGFPAIFKKDSSEVVKVCFS